MTDGDGHRLFVARAALVVLAALAFLPVLGGGFLNWDDDVYVTKNPLVTDRSAGQAGRILTTFVSGNYHPLTVASHALDHRLFGPAPRPHHAVSLALHLLNALLLHRFLLALGTPAAGAFFGALLWAVHPLRAEPVAWISGRKDLLAALFSLLALLLHPPPGAARRRARLALSLGAFLLALLSKATAVALPAALLLCDWLRGRRLGEALREKLPHFVLAAAFGVLAVAARRTYQGVLDEGAYGGGTLLFLGAIRSAWYFLLRSVLPLSAPDWLYPDIPPGRPLLSARFLLTSGALVLVALTVALSLRRTRKIAFGALFFAVTILPALPAAVLGWSADRFTYLPSVGLVFLAGELAAVLWVAAARAGPAATGLALVGAALAAASLGLISFHRAGTWSSSERLWTEAIVRSAARGVTGANLAYAHLYRARARVSEGRPEAALEDLREAARLEPAGAVFHGELGVALGEAGRHREAEAEFTRALELAPGVSATWFNRGLARLSLGAAQDAAADFARALREDRANHAALLGRARALAAAGDPAGALRGVEAFLAARPGDPEGLALRAELEAVRATPAGRGQPPKSPSAAPPARAAGP